MEGACVICFSSAVCVLCVSAAAHPPPLSKNLSRSLSPRSEELLEPLLPLKVRLDVRHALGGDRIDRVQRGDAVLVVKYLHFIKIR